MKSACILTLLVLIGQLALSAPASVSDVHGEEAINIATPVSEHASDTLFEKVFVGSIKSNKYHYPSCEWAQKIKPENEICFSSSADARSQGYVPCKVCNPP
jgi:hypothetical protein